MVGWGWGWEVKSVKSAPNVQNFLYIAWFDTYKSSVKSVQMMSLMRWLGLGGGGSKVHQIIWINLTTIAFFETYEGSMKSVKSDKTVQRSWGDSLVEMVWGWGWGGRSVAKKSVAPGCAGKEGLQSTYILNSACNLLRAKIVLLSWCFEQFLLWLLVVLHLEIWRAANSDKG